MEEFTIKIKKDGRVLVTEEDELTKKEKEMEPQDLIKILSDSIQHKVTDSYGALVSRDCIYYGVIERVSGIPSTVVGFYRDARIRPYNHHGEVLNVGYPPLLFFYHIIEDSVTDVAICAVKHGQDDIRPNTPVYHYPYANTVHDGFVACLGNFRHPKVQDPVWDARFFPEAFLTIENVHVQNAAGQAVKDLLDNNQEKDFNLEQLTYMNTLENFIENFSNRRTHFSYRNVGNYIAV